MSNTQHPTNDPNEVQCIADGDLITLWDCPCTECRGLRAQVSSNEPRAADFED